MALAWAATTCALPSPAQATTASEQPGSALVVFAPVGASQLAAIPGLSIGIMSATQGRYSTAQLLLDMTQGARIAASAYDSSLPPPLSLVATGSAGFVRGWPAARARAESAPQLLRPGLLAARIGGGGGYAGITGEAHTDGVLAADLNGHVAAVSLGPPETLLARCAQLRATHRLVVADLPGGREGAADLLELTRRREPRELLIVLQRTPDAPGHELLWSAAAGLPGAGAHELTSVSTDERGLISAVDVAPTVLTRLGIAIPPDMRGKPIETDGGLRLDSIEALMRRLRVIGGRRLSALGWLLCAWLMLLALCASRPRSRAWALRVGALGVLWAPVAVLIPAALEPGAAAEYAMIALACLALGALSDAALPWPRAPIAPALAAIVILTADALAHTQLLMRSLLGPDPLLGARFYGIGNELKSGLAVLVLTAVAGALYPAARGRRAALAMAGAGVVLAIVEGSARIGAGVGGVILVCFSFAVASVLLLGGGGARRALIVLIAPLAGLIALAAIDLLTAHGSGHFTGSVLHARSAGDLRDLIVRRYSAAWGELHNHVMPVATVVALAYALVGLKERERLLAPVHGDPAWLAAMAGGLAAGVVGALVEDSGPVLLVVAVFTLGCVATYLWGQEDAPRAAPAQGAAPGAREQTLSAAR